jgi:hypothetical protein
MDFHDKCPLIFLHISQETKPMPARQLWAYKMNDKDEQITLLSMGMELQWKSEFSGKSVRSDIPLSASDSGLRSEARGPLVSNNEQASVICFAFTSFNLYDFRREDRRI